MLRLEVRLPLAGLLAGAAVAVLMEILTTTQVLEPDFSLEFRMLRLLENLIAALLNFLFSSNLRSSPSPQNDDTTSPAADGLLIGRTVATPGDAEAPLRLSWKWLERCVYLCGASGSGKTSLLMVIIDALIGRIVNPPSVAKAPSDRAASLIVVDFRQDLLVRVLMALAKHGRSLAHRTHIFDFARLHELPPFNPLSSQCGLSDPYTRSALVLSVIESLSSSWGTTMQEVGRHALLALAFSNRSLADVSRLFSDPLFRASVLASVPDDLTLAWFAMFNAATPKRQAELSGPFSNKVNHFLVRPEIRKWLGSEHSISFGELLDGDEPVVILIGLSADTLSNPVARLLGGLLLATITNLVLARTAVYETDRKPVRIVVDEFQNICSLPQFPYLLSEGRRYKCACLLAHQYALQLAPELRQAIVGNSAMSAYFQNDAAQAAALAPNVTSDLPSEAIKSMIVSQPQGQCFLLRRGEPTVQLKVAHYHDPSDVTPTMVAAFRTAAYAKIGQPAATPTVTQLPTDTGHAPAMEIEHVSKPDIT